MSTNPGLQLLLVEPDDDLRYLLQTLLELTGCAVETARSYREALVRIDATPPDVIFTELLFEDAAGLGLGRRYRSLPQLESTWLVALTGHCQPGIAKDALEAGFDHYLVKPVYFPEIFEILKPVAWSRGCGLIDIGLPRRYEAATLSPPRAQ